LAEQSEIDRHIHRVRAGEADAFEPVVRAYEWPIRAFVISRCPPAGDADDVAQNTFITAFRRIGEYEPGTDFKAWMFAIARYELLAEQTRLRRKADYHSRYAPHALMAELERRATDPAEALESVAAGGDPRSVGARGGGPAGGGRRAPPATGMLNRWDRSPRFWSSQRSRCSSCGSRRSPCR